MVANVLPFGINVAPYVFTRITSWLAREIRKRFHLNVGVYIDDFIIGSSTRQQLEQGLKGIKTFFKRLGVCLSEKTSHEPSQAVEFIGFWWDAATKEVSVTKEKRKQYRRQIKNLLRHAQSKQCWKKVIGKLIFLKEAVGPALRHTRSLIKTLQHTRKDKLITPEGEARDDLMWWEQTLRSTPRMSLKLLQTSGVVTTDASDTNVGAIIETFPDHPTKKEEKQRKKVEISLPVENKESHINIKELHALLQAIQKNKRELKGKKIIWYTDNCVARAAVAKQGSQRLSKEAWEETKRILDLVNKKRIQIVPQWIPGRLNCRADTLSRPSETKGEWEEALVKVTGEFGPLSEDPFGFTDAPTSIFSTLEWVGKRTLLVPRVHEIDNVLTLLGKVVTKEKSQLPPTAWKSLAVLVTPLWRGALWWPKLEALRAKYIPLGRLHSKELTRWEERNGHPSEWTASLIPIRKHFGPPEQ